MSSLNSQPCLPPELILSIIEYFVPVDPIPIALPPSHPTTKTLLSLARTSSITYPTARRLLYTYCLWIDSEERLGLLDKSLKFPAPTRNNARPTVPIIEYITSLYLSYPTIEDMSPASSLHSTFSLLGPSLRRLVVDMPLRSGNFHWEDIFNTNNTLRSAFSQLTALHMLCSVRDELPLGLYNPAGGVFETWKWDRLPKLKILALYNKDVSAYKFWKHLGTLVYLETLVLTRADGLEYVDMKAEWREYCGDETRGLDIVLVNVEGDHRVPLGKASWKDDDKVKIRELNVPTSYYGDENPIELCQEWVKRRMLRGEAPAEWA